MNRLFGIFILVLSLVACSEDGDGPEKPDGGDSKISTRVIYGEDDRKDLFQVTNPIQRLKADSSAALIRNNRLQRQNDGTILLATLNFGREYRLCSDEPYRDQGVVAFCSGFAIGQDVMITAGHCIKSQSDCDSTSFVFNYGIKSQGQMPVAAKPEDIFQCKTLVHTQTGPNGIDFAIVKVDRPVGRLTAKMRTSGLPGAGDPLFVVGHPVGLPTKVADGATVRSVQEGFLVASLDTYGGNSGSAVFNARSGDVEGILVRGEVDFKYRGSCRISNACSQDGCRGEDVTRIDHVQTALRQYGISF